ncbi:SDR family NAD(P)-dependent oxidoreductase [Asticcacaulis sp.]|uniref:SDR family NAD(P)-dependent oxidoreductase n=1 Tax=Asticcacaulis sp. TaxID=1872648 RepID=UPI003F7B5862
MDTNNTTQMRYDGSPTGRPLALVTGASSGIGYELAIQFAKNGYDLFIVSGSEGIERAADQLKDFNIDVKAVRHDLTQESEVDALCDDLRATGRPIAVAALNAGVGVGGKFFETDLCKELDLIKLNILSTVHVAKHLVQYMIEKGEGGKILFTSSVAAGAPGPYEAVYAASKAFIQSFALALRHELKEKGIQVTSLQPGPTDTNFFHRADMDNTKVAVSEKDDPAEVAKDGFDALMSEKDHVVAGSMKNKMMTTHLIPDAVKISQHADMAKPGGASNVQGGPKD